METIEKILENNIWLNLVFLILAIMSIVVSIIIHNFSRKIIRPSYNIKNTPIITNKENNKLIKLKYDGKKVDNLTLTEIAFWNNGKKILEQNDIAKKDPLKIVLTKNHQFIDLELKYESNEACNLSINEDYREINEIKINFDYLSFNDGMILKIYHTASENDDLKLEGTFKDGSKIDLRASNTESLFMGNFLDYLNKKSVLKFLPFFIRAIISVALATIIFPIAAIIEISVSPYNKISKVYLLK